MSKPNPSVDDKKAIVDPQIVENAQQFANTAHRTLREKFRALPNNFFRGAVIGYALGVIGTRRIIFRPLICAAVFGYIWNKAGFEL